MERLNLNLHEETLQAIEETIEAEKQQNKTTSAGEIIRHAIAEYYLRHYGKHLPILFEWGGDRRKERAG